jgi:putative aldouronate transport system substrate-binding protein
MKRWYDRGYLNRAPFANTTLSKTSFAQGRSAVGFGNSQDVQEVLAQAQARGYEPEILPLLSSTGRSAADGYTGNGVALAATGKHPRLTLQVLDRIMEDPEIVRLVSFGVEGRHWVNQGGRIALPPGVDLAENPYPIEAAGFWFVNKDLLPPLARWSPAYQELRRRVPGWLVPNAFFGFSFVPQAVKNEVAAITTVMTQYGDVLAIGAVADVDKAIAALEARLKAARQDRVVAELRTQLEAFSRRGAGTLGATE